MSQTINRMYDSIDRANNAAWALRVEHYDDVHVFGGSAHAGLSADELTTQMAKARVLKSEARVYAARVKQGHALVCVHAPFGMADAAMTVLQRFSPIDSGVPDAPLDRLLWDEAAPISSAFRWRVLLDDSATFSRFWNVAPLLKRGATTSSSLGLPESQGSRGPFGGTFPLPLLSSKGTMLSSMLGLPLLSKRRGAAR